MFIVYVAIVVNSNSNPLNFLTHKCEWGEEKRDPETSFEILILLPNKKEHKRSLKTKTKKSQHMFVFFKVCQSCAFININMPQEESLNH